MTMIIDAIGYDSEDTTDEILYVAMVARRRDGGLIMFTSRTVKEHRIQWNSTHIANKAVPFEMDAYFKMVEPQVTPVTQLIPDRGTDAVGIRGIYMPDGTFMALGNRDTSVKHTPSKTPVERANISGRRKRDKEQG